MNQTMRIIHISDTHAKHHRMPVVFGDVLVVSGDISTDGSEAEFLDSLIWMENYPCKHRILVPGNHDYYIEQEPQRARIACQKAGVHLLIDELLVLNDQNFYGCPWIQYDPRYEWPLQDRAFCLPIASSSWREKYAAIPANVDFLICHDPPWGIGDCVAPGSYWTELGVEQPGNQALRHFLDSHPDLGFLFFGHVHDNPGVQRYNQTWCSNAAGIAIQLDIQERQLSTATLIMPEPVLVN